MKNNGMFKQKALVSAMAFVASTSVYAQENIEEVLVTGIRASVQASMDVKRQSRGVVDSINTEDIGKFPDNNLAESLQRISGVSISRNNGEGSQVTVRGFGADANMVTLNNRIMPATSLPQNGGGNSTSRAFDMSNIASEGVSAVEVYKTSKANIASGGIGATINIKTARPFDKPGLNLTGGVKLVNDTTNRVGDDITPEVFGLFSWTDDDDRIGFGLNFSHQKRDSGASGAFVSNWNTAAFDGTLPQSPVEASSGAPLAITNAPDIGQLRSIHSDLRYFHADRERERTNAQVVVQFKSTDNVTTTLDYTYSEQDLFESRSELSAWMSDSFKSDVQFDNNPVAAPALYWEERRDNNPRDVGLALQQQNQVNKNEALGLNFEWLVNDQLTLELDFHDASASSLPDADFGNWINIGLGSNVSRGQGVDFTSDFPVLLIDFDDGPGIDPDADRTAYNNNGVLDKSEVGSAVRQIFNDRAETDITQMQLNGSFEFDDSSSIDFGIERRNMTNNSRSSFYQQTLEGGWGVTTPGDVPPELLEPINYASLFDGYSTQSSNQAYFDGVSNNTARPLIQGFSGDAAAIGEVLSDNANLPWQVNPNDGTNRTIEEDVSSVFVQYDRATELAGKPLNILVGARYESTSIRSSAIVVEPQDVVWQSNNDFNIPTPEDGVRTTLSENASYHHFLPNLDLDWEFYDNVKARFSYGKTIARQTYEKLGIGISGLSGPTLPTVIPGSILGGAQRGEAGLRPLESTNMDVSLEWYFGETSYASVGYFKKDVENFPGTSRTTESAFGLLDPTNGPRAQQAIADLAAQGIPLTDTNLFTQVAANQEGVDFNDRSAEQFETDVDVVGQAGDALAQFDVSIPAANIEGSIDGIELAVQHFFGETGFGVMANYTMVDTDTEFDVNGDPTATQFAIAGISDSANLVLMYEKNNIQTRVAYNWRDDFLDAARTNANEPRFTEAYAQLDFNIGYQINDNLSVSFEGLNVAREDARQYNRYASQLRRLEILGPRYQIGARYSF